MQRPDWVPDEIDTERPSAARMYDYYLDGAHNFAADRTLARQVLEQNPGTRQTVRANRAFLGRAVRFLLDAGVRQFLDVGSGIPTAGNVHEIAQSADPLSRVVYVDNDPVAVAHSEAILAGNDHAAVVNADLRAPQSVLGSPQVARLLDLNQPVGLLMIAVLHFIPDEDDPAAVISHFRDALAAGSHVAVTTVTDENWKEEYGRAGDLYRRTRTPVVPRNRHQVRALLTGWEVVEPGIVWVPEWHPDWQDDVGDDPSWAGMIGGVARKS